MLKMDAGRTHAPTSAQTHTHKHVNQIIVQNLIYLPKHIKKYRSLANVKILQQG